MELELFDSHLHIIDDRFPLVANRGYLPPGYTVEQYLSRMAGYRLRGGAVVSGSFQGFDQRYLESALEKLGDAFVGVTQLPASVSDEEILRLYKLGVRAVRFNLRRGGSEAVSRLSEFAHRIYDLAGWHVELYVDSSHLADLSNTLIKLPAVSVDHLGLSRSGFPHLLQLAEQGVRVKASGFGRVDFEIAGALKNLYNANPEALMFGTDLPSTRSPRPYNDQDFLIVTDSLGREAAERVLSLNAINFYRINREYR